VPDVPVLRKISKTFVKIQPAREHFRQSV